MVVIAVLFGHLFLLGSAERERERFRARVKKLDLELAVGEGGACRTAPCLISSMTASRVAAIGDRSERGHTFD
jgi:hypothetical protein